MTFPFAVRGDTTNSNLQNMEPVPETEEEQVPEDLGKLTVVDKARTGRVRVTVAISISSDQSSPLCFLMHNNGKYFSI